ncbi:MAG: ferrous iron transport protein B [Rikenellaceae bacterium]|nr:ferrous iron transport protein B [Rikenellaceae bacterium]
MRLSELKTGESATVVKVLGYGGFRRRIMEMGFVRGQEVTVILDAPLKDPIEYHIMGYDISLRRKEAEMIVVMTREEAAKISEVEASTLIDGEDIMVEALRSSHNHITIGLVGNPNAGKTSLFNTLCGRSEHVGNYSGVTVDAKRGELKYKGYTIEITDLPGTYALSAYSPEEMYVRRHIIDHTPDIIVNTVVASNLERNLYLTTELIDISPKMVIALNMYDELERSGAKFDHEALGKMIGVPIVPVVATSERGIEEFLDTIIAVYENRDQSVRHIHIGYGSVIEEHLKELNDDMRQHRNELTAHFPPRYFALKLIEGDKEIISLLSTAPHFDRWNAMAEHARTSIEQALGEDIETALAGQKYGFISGALKETYAASEHKRNTLSDKLDAIVTHRIWGFPIFFALMWFMFYCTFTLGAYPQEWIDMGISWLYDAVKQSMDEGPLRDMLTDGVISGVGSVLVFLPNIMILYLFISLLEDSGYLARAAFIMDKVMHHMGVHGKSFIPMIMGFGCNVPAVMACRTIECTTSRIITIMVVPFMSCSARLPIYMMIVGTFFKEHAGTALFLLYLFGMIMAVISARLMRRFMFREQEAPFVMELSPYRIPTAKATLRHMWTKCAQYVKKMGGLILIASIIIWLLSYYPRPQYNDTMAEAPNYELSYMGKIGQVCEPIFAPMDMEWQATVALISGIPAKEIVVSTMNVLYAQPGDEAPESDEELSPSASERIARSMSIPTAVAFLIFSLLYLPCIATIIGIGSELNWKWAVGSALYNTALAWIVAWIGFHLTTLIL